MKVQVTLVASFVAFAVAELAHAGVIVVDAAGGGSFTQIQPAIDAALEGDTILVKPGDYAGSGIYSLWIEGKSLTVVGDVGTLPSLSRRVRVENLAAGQVVTLARLKAQAVGGSSSFAAAVEVENCLGAVRVVSCDFTAKTATSGSPGMTHGATVTESHDVAFTGCAVRGGDELTEIECVSPSGANAIGGFGLRVWGASVASYECAIDGGHGRNGGDTTGSGGEAVYVTTNSSSSTPAFFFASRSNIHGGVGGSTDCIDYGCAKSGGDGVHLQNAFGAPDPIGWFLDLMVGGGAPGTWINGSQYKFCGPVAPGIAYSGIPAFTFSVASLGFTIPAVAREGTHVTVTFTGEPGSRVYLNDQLTTTFEATASWRGVLLSPFPTASAPAREIKWGVIPASGVLTRTYPVPQLPPGVQAQTRYLQPYRLGANGITLGSFRTLTVLDSAF